MTKFKSATDYFRHKVDGVMHNFNKTTGHDEQTKEAVRKAYNHASQKYFLKASVNGNETLNLLEQGGKLTPTTFGHLKQELELEFGADVVKSSGAFKGQDQNDYPVRKVISYIQAEEYLPAQLPIILKDSRITLNTWEAPKIRPKQGIRVTESRIKPWKEYLERMMPDETERDYFERFLAITIRRPSLSVDIAPLLRGEQGTGKNFLMDQIIAPLVGDTNAKTVELGQMMSRFRGDLFRSTVLMIDELYSSQKKSADRLKVIVTQREARSDEKYEKQVQVKTYYNLIVASNSEAPLYIEEGDRRWWVPQYIRHRYSTEETSDFIAVEMVPWLENGGLQTLANHLENLAKDTDIKMFATAPDTQSKRDIMTVDKRPEFVELLCQYLKEEEKKKSSLTLVELEENPQFGYDQRTHEAKLTRYEISQVLKSEGWGSYRGRTNGNQQSKWRKVIVELQDYPREKRS